MKIVYPNYNNCIVNLINSVLKYFDADYHHNTLKEVDRLLEEKQFKNVVLILNDGLGSKNLDRSLDANSFLIKNKLTDITSVFPATTTAAYTSVTSGLMPNEHCWLGWYLYVSDIDKTITTYLNTLKDSNVPAAEYNVPSTHFPYKLVLDNINEKGKYKAYSISPTSDGNIKYDPNKPDDMYEIASELCKADGKKFLYVYYANPDFLMHTFGTDCSVVKENIQYINDSIEKLCNSLSDTLVIVTADHGLIDVEYEFLSNYPELKSTLLRETSIEGRAVNFFIKPNMKEQFEKQFYNNFKDYFILLTKQEVIEKKIFGIGKDNEKFKSCLGDYLAIGISNKAIKDDVEENLLLAHHAGITEDEMMVPLIIIDKK